MVTHGVASGDGAEAVGRFYDQHAEAFQRVYGDVIQAFRTTDVTRLLDHEAASMELHPGMRVLDAGCGVCGPAVYFAQRYGVSVDAITASPRQALAAAERIREGGVEDRVTVRQGDFHHLAEHLVPESYDVVCFLESFGHSRDKRGALASAWQMLRRGGRLYLKDLFVREVSDARLRQRIAENVQRINEAYVYDVSDLYEVLRESRRLGFILSSLGTVDIPLEEFEDLTISNEFQELTGINRIDDLGVYAFPVDFLEMSCLKPWYDPASGNNRYFLQNLYNLRLRGVAEHEL